MKRDEIKNEIFLIINEQEDICINFNMDENTSLLNGGMNSLLFVKVLVNLEIVFDIEFEEDLINMVNEFTLKMLIDYVQEKIDAKGE